MTVIEARRKAILFVVTSMCVALIQSLFLSYLWGMVFDYFFLQQLFGIKPGSSTQIVITIIFVIVLVRLVGYCAKKRAQYLDDKAEEEEKVRSKGPVVSQDRGGGQSPHIQDSNHGEGAALSDPLITGGDV